MVDPTKGIGSIQNLISGSRVSESKQTPEAKNASPKDEVKLSSEALSLSKAEQVASSVRETLESDTDVTLGSGKNFDESL
jgi:hypothetical protein